MVLGGYSPKCLEDEFSEEAAASKLCYLVCKRFVGERLGKGWEKAHATASSARAGGYGFSLAAGKRGSTDGKQGRH